jgi:hypothetical protein
MVIGCVAGIMGGMLGLGGGLVIVPMLDLLFSRVSIAPEVAMHLILGTSLASIVFTYTASIIAHRKHHTVRWDLWKITVPTIIIGTLLGSSVAAHTPGRVLKTIFACFLIYIAIKTAFPKKNTLVRAPWGAHQQRAAGLAIGAFSSMVGVGGGSLTVPMLLRSGATMLQSTATSTALGLPLTISGSLGYIYHGWNAAELPEGSFGFVYLPALLGIASTSIFFASIGVKLAHKLPAQTLKRIFALVIFFAAAQMIRSLL